LKKAKNKLKEDSPQQLLAYLIFSTTTHILDLVNNCSHT